jgi:hypothetical protein
MTLNYNTFMQSCADYAEAASVVQMLRDRYWRDKAFLTTCDKFSGVPGFQDKFDTLTLIGADDYGATASQRIYAIRQDVIAWETDADIRAMLGLPPL